MHIFLPAFFCGVLVFLLAGEPQTVEKRLNSLDSPRSQRDDQVFPVQLILEMMTVAIRQGASVPRACEAVGMAMKTDLGSCLCQISQSLYRGASWEDAWGLSRSLPSQTDRPVIFFNRLWSLRGGTEHRQSFGLKLLLRKRIDCAAGQWMMLQASCLLKFFFPWASVSCQLL